MLSRLSQVRGQVDDALETAGKILASAGISSEPVSDFRELLAAAEAEGVSGDRITVDFGIVRGLAYYTGMLFDIYAGDSNGDTLGGGGRYDGLTRVLGYDRDVPALGFAYNLDAIVESRSRELDPSPDLTVVSPVETGSVDSAIQQARQLRASGKRAAIDFESPSSQGEGQGER